MKTGWTPPGNRSNQHIKGWRIRIYNLPKQDKTGILTDVTEKANRVLATATSKYTTGQRVKFSLTGRYSSVTTGVISMVSYNAGLIEYVIHDDTNTLYIIPESRMMGVVSLALVPVTVEAHKQIA